MFSCDISISANKIQNPKLGWRVRVSVGTGISNSPFPLAGSVSGMSFGFAMLFVETEVTFLHHGGPLRYFHIRSALLDILQLETFSANLFKGERFLANRSPPYDVFKNGPPH